MPRRATPPAPAVCAAAALTPTVEIVELTPELAREWLASNTKNRRIRKAVVDRYARDMASDRWRDSEAMICFDIHGNMLNGQHRLYAVIKANVTVRVVVQRNVPPEAMSTMDTGAGRTGSDALGLQGETNPTTLAATLKLAYLMEREQLGRQKTIVVSVAEMEDLLDRCPEIRESVRCAVKYNKTLAVPASAVALVHWMISDAAGDDHADNFLARLATRVNEPEGSPILALDSRLRQIQMRNETVRTPVYVNVLLRTWNALASGKSMRQISTRIPKGKELTIPAALPWTVGVHAHSK